MLSAASRLLPAGRPRGRKWANPSKESSRLNTQEGPEPSRAPPAPTARTASYNADGPEGGYKEKGRSREAFVPAFLVEGSFMRTLTFPLRASLRGPQLQDGGGGAYMNYT